MGWVIMAHAFKLRRQKQANPCEFSLVYRVTSRAVRATQRNPVSTNKQPNNKNLKQVFTP